MQINAANDAQTWQQRLKIAIGAAQGQLYVSQESSQSVVFSDF